MLSLPLFLNDVGGSEILLIMMVVLLFFGSKSIPGIAKTLGRTLYEFRNATAELQNEIKKSGVDIKGDLNLESLLKEKADTVMQPMDQVFSDIENTVHYSVSNNSTSQPKIEEPTNTVENAAIEEGNTEPKEVVNTEVKVEISQPETKNPEA
jgi:sec-independent protein translocase protein TatA